MWGMPEAGALRSAKCQVRGGDFRGMESLAMRRGEIYRGTLNLDAQERLWQEVKRGE